MTTGTPTTEKLAADLARKFIAGPEYYKVRGWEAAFPTDETLKRLGLDECIGK